MTMCLRKCQLRKRYYKINFFLKALPDPNAGLMEAFQMDSHNRAKLQKMYDEVLGFYNSLPPQYKDNLNSAIPDIVNTFATRRSELDSGELIIMVAGT